MSAPPLLYFEWDGEAMVPLRPQVADKHFVVGQTYPLEVREDRSIASHRHFFAAVNEAWKNLPDDLGARFPTPDHLRRWALIKAGFRDERSVVCASKAEAQRVAAFIKPIDDYAVVVARDAVVIIYTAKSQSARAMGKARFNASKEAVLGVLSEMIGVSPDTLKQNAEQAA